MSKNSLIAIGLIAVMSGLAGCYDYRSGKHWNVVSNGDWQQASYIEWVNNACHSPATITTHQSREGTAHSLFLVPLGLGSPAKNPDSTKFFVTAKGLSTQCNNRALKVKVNGLEEPGTQISVCQKDRDCCAIAIPLKRDDMDNLKVEINASGTSCRYTPLVLDSRTHICLRETKFGGSNGCDY
ncbi:MULTISPECIES: hypothetical protein [Pseudomonas]|uniref:hypothetical protein n=1 Tax=Pseudomonas TaxID=286 RepID=UPI0011B82D7D|nr:MULTISPECIES: hypothetical protein [Pseudomonas]